jgi:hypothetical protein
MLKKLLFFGLSIFINVQQLVGQCAMCRTQVVNNVSAGETSFAAGLNTGILYLFFTPYVLISLIIYLWFKHSKENERKRDLSSIIKG